MPSIVYIAAHMYLKLFIIYLTDISGRNGYMVWPVMRRCLLRVR